MQNITQNGRIFAWLKSGKSLTGIEALDLFNCFRLSARVKDIKEQNPGIDIRDEYVHKNGKQFKKYWIHKPEPPKDLFLSSDAVQEHEFSRK